MLSPQRATVLDHLRRQAPARTNDIASQLGLHPNTVREHLEALLDSGLVTRTSARAHGRGRPAWLYRASPDSEPDVRVRDYAGLAAALAGHLARTSADPEADARSAGREWGRELIREAADGNAADDTRPPRARVLDLLTTLGFAPDDSGSATDGVALRRCPLLDAARRYPAIVCQVHLGIVQGALAELGAPPPAPRELDLIPFSEPGACRLLLPGAPDE
ncbi:MAG: helix-turn-helix domain-containing protein [Rhodococcus sp. (in: high G+C Gram-positive bacteria)]